MRLLSLALGVLFVSSGCATTTGSTTDEPVVAEAATSGGEAAVEEQEEEPDIVCRRVAVTGSRIKKKVCTTRAQREEMRKGAREFMERSRTPEIRQ